MGFWELASGLAYGCSSGLLDEGQDRTHRVLRVGAEDVAFLRRLDPLPSELEVFQGYCRQNLKGRQAEGGKGMAGRAVAAGLYDAP